MAECVDFIRRFDEVSRHYPHAAALVGDAVCLDYAALREASIALAVDLDQRGIVAGEVVALAAGRTPAHVVGMLAAWRIGAAVLPIDDASPPARVDAMLREAGVRVIMRCSGLETLRTGPAAPLGRPEDRLAYLVYTSGSSGAPKGVRVSHAALTAVLMEQISAFGLRPFDRALLTLSTAFDASISDIGTALLAGAALVMPAAPAAPRELMSTLLAHGITHADLPPSLLRLLDPAALPASVRCVVIGGEVCPPDTVRKWAKYTRVINVYGPTEATICTSLCVCDAETWSAPKIGLPLAHVVYRVVEDELWIGGPALALGYLDRPALDAQRFVDEAGARWYRTGDRVRRAQDGSLVFVGRVDRQVKVRGQLIAPEEIEAALLSHPNITEARVALDADQARATLTAWVVTGDPNLSPRGVRAHLESTLPRWMIPRIVMTGALARGVCGKVEDPSGGAGPSALPSDPRVTAVVRAFEAVLGIANVAPDDDFLALGGDSLAALEVSAHAQIEGVSLSGSSVLACLTPRAIAAAPRDEGDEHRSLVARGALLGRELVATASGAAARGPAGGDDLVLTGATGFLGSRLLAALLDRWPGTIRCLVRASDDASARLRLGACQDHPRVVAHAADIDLPHLGLSEARWRALAERTGSIVHVAAVVNLVLPYGALARTNVAAVAAMVRLATQSRGAKFTFVSSLSALVSTSAATGVLGESAKLAPETRVFGGYAQTKQVAEALVTAALPDAMIVRPGLLTGDSGTGVCAQSCQLMTFARQLAAIGCVPQGDHARLRFDVTPVDYAARAIASLIASAPTARLVHVASERGASLADLLAAMADRAPMAQVDAATFRARAGALLARGTAVALVSSARRLLSSQGHEGEDLFLMTDRSFDVSLARALTGLPVPHADGALLARYLDFGLATR